MKTLHWIVLALVSSGCGSSGEAGRAGAPAIDRPVVEDAKNGVVIVKNPTRDTWDLVVAGVPQGSVAPGSEARLLRIPRGRQTVVATNTVLGLTQSSSVDAGKGTPIVELKALVGRLRVNNPHSEAVAISVDGTLIGTADASSEVLFDVPAGRRTLMLRSARGPGAVRVEKVMPADGETLLTVPALDSQVVDPNAPKPPEGKGLVRMRNASRLAVTVVADGKDYGLVPAGAVFDLVLEPGAHKLEVRIEGIEARTEHTVTLLPNQVAEWVWGEEGRLPEPPQP